jgi:hypothetical protein
MFNRMLRDILTKRAAVSCLGAALLLCVAASASAASSQKPGDEQREAFREMANDLISGIDQTRRTQNPDGTALADYMKKAYDYVQPKRLRVAVAPFKQADIKLSKLVADDFNESLYAALIKKAGRRYDFVARRKLDALITDLQDTGAWEAAGGNPINALMRSAESIDVLVEGKIRMGRKNARLSYTALGMDGRVLAQTQPQTMALTMDDAKISRATMTLDRAIKDAAEHLSSHAHDLKVLLEGGIRFEDTGTQPEFGRYLQGRLSQALKGAFSNVVSGKLIRTEPLRGYRGFDRGIDITGKVLKTANVKDRENAYVLRGSYWELPGAIELRVDLRGSKGASTEWIGWINSEETAGRILRPKGDFGTLRENDGRGPFAFHLTSDRDKNAAYRIGERMNLLIRLDRDAWTYCFYTQADGKTIQILPNPEFWKHAKEPRLARDVVHTIPGDKLFPFNFEFVPPTGMELVKCFAASRDVTAELPKVMQGRTLTPLPRDLALQLSNAFRQLQNVAISEASFVVTLSE